MTSSRFIGVRALSVQDMRNGTFLLELESRDLTREEHQTITELFPNLSERVFQVLNQEALLGALATEEESHTPPTANSGKPVPKY